MHKQLQTHKIVPSVPKLHPGLHHLLGVPPPLSVVTKVWKRMVEYLKLGKPTGHRVMC